MSNTQKKINEVVEYRGLPPIKKGWRCEVDGKQGRIWGGNHCANLNILFDGDKKPMNCHPEYKMKIFDDKGNVVHKSNDS